MTTRPTTTGARQPTIVLVGAGHAHLHIAARAQAYRDAGARLLLIDSGEFWYSGMATGLLGGEFDPDEDRIDPNALMQASGGAFIREAVTRICPDSRRITLASGRTLDYDWLSLNVGSEVDTQSLPTADNGPQIWPVKPIPPLYSLRLSLEAAMRDQASMPPVVIIGGGATGSELAANLAGLARRCGVAPQVTLVSRSSRLLTLAPAGAARSLQAALDDYPVALRLSTEATRITQTGVELASGEVLPAAHVVMAVGLQAKALTRALGLPAGPQGLKVGPTMQSIADPRVFAAGDCADYQPRALPKLGVFGVKAAEVIHHNLLASLQQRPLRPYQPQRRWLAILNLGNGQGLLLWWRFWWRGRFCAWLKNRIDRRFMAQYRRAGQAD